MTGLVNRTNRTLLLVRTSLELTVLLVGFLLGGTVGVGTILFAVAIGPLIQFFLPQVAVPIKIPAAQPQVAEQR
jgi:uncharacterized membrane protein YczE